MKTLFMHSDPRVRGRPVLLSAVLPRGKAITVEKKNIAQCIDN